MAAEARLVIAEGMYPHHVDTSAASLAATTSDLNMLVATGGRTRSEREQRELLAGAGLDVIRIVATRANVQLIEAHAAC